MESVPVTGPNAEGPHARLILQVAPGANELDREVAQVLELLTVKLELATMLEKTSAAFPTF